MATTAQGTTYVESSDLVSAYPTASLAVANAIDTKATLAMTQNPQTGTSYTAVLADAYKLVTMSNAAASTFTVPPEASVAWPTATQLRILNIGAGVCTITQGAGVTINGTPLAVAQHKGGCLVKTSTNTWTFIPFSSGSAPATVSGTTGSPTVDTSSRPGKTIYTFDGSGSITVATGGTAEIIRVGGGGGGGCGTTTNGGGGGGGGGGFHESVETLTPGSKTITIGGGGSATASNYTRGGNGSPTTFNRLAVAGGGGGGGGYSGGTASGLAGTSGGGAGTGPATQAGGAATASAVTGYDGGNTTGSNGGSGGGGYGATGANTPALEDGGNGGAGVSTSITGSPVGYCGGGGGDKGTGTAGTGTDGGGNAQVAGVRGGGGGGGRTPGSGGGGRVIVVIG